MKSVTLIFIFLVFSIGVGAQQDTIVSTKGLIIPAYIKHPIPYLHHTE